MKNLLLLFTFLLIISCNSEFKDRSQAKNEVNKKGLRDGRWVDFFDDDNNKISDTTNFTSYLLSEYEEGKPINAFKKYFKNGLIKEEGRFLSDSITYGINSLPDKFLNNYINYSEDGRIQEIKLFNELGNILENQYNFKKDTLRLVYKYFPTKQNKFEKITLTSANKDAKIIFQYSDTSWYDDENNLPNEFHDFVSNFYKKNLSENMTSEEIVKATSKILLNIYLNKQTTFYCNSMFSGEDKVTDVKQLNLIFYKTWKSNKSSTASNGGSGSSGDVKSCSYCGRNFYKNQGYVVGPSIGCAKNYSSAMNAIAFASKAGYSKSNLRQLMADYELGQYYCSRKCVNESGTSMCPY
jgi:hypothetical protein